MQLLIFFLAVLGLHCCLVVGSRGCSSFRAWTSHCGALSLQSSAARACGFRGQQRTGSVTSRHVGSSWTRDQACVTWSDRWIPDHWTTKKVLSFLSFLNKKLGTGRKFCTQESSSGSCLISVSFHSLCVSRHLVENGIE